MLLQRKLAKEMLLRLALLPPLCTVLQSSTARLLLHASAAAAIGTKVR
jgi:hypothetical protein